MNMGLNQLYNTSVEVSVEYLSGYAVATSSSKRIYKNLEPEGIKVYYYKGSYKIFIGFKVNDYKSAIFYFDT